MLSGFIEWATGQALINGSGIMDSEKLSQEYWEQVPHFELPQYATDEKTSGDLKALSRFLKPTDRILDLGCGWGRITCALARNAYNVIGLDLSENLITYARQSATELGLKIRFDLGSMMSIPYPEESFDKLICLWGAFNHLLTPSDQVKALNEMYRVLKPDGLAFIEMGNGERKKYRQIIGTVSYGHESRVWNSQFKEGTPSNVLYIHDRRTLTRIAKKSKFEKFRVRFQNINHKICAFLGDVDRAATLYELLLPYDGRTVVVGGATACYGAAARRPVYRPIRLLRWAKRLCLAGKLIPFARSAFRSSRAGP
jgi:ubiquinone/menaquinone biosynthesis C-methylase UbiE